MNIVYKFTSSVTGKFYIGSKTECKVIDGMIFDREGRAYFTSSLDDDLLDEFANGNMILEVLEENIVREKLLDREAYHQRSYNAVEDENCYNRIYSDLKDINGRSICFGRSLERHTHDYYGNIFKETVREITWRNRSVGRRDTKAQELGFDNYGELHLWGLELRANNSEITFNELDRRLGANGFFYRSLKGICYEDFQREDIDLVLVKDLLIKGKTLIKICEDLDYPESVVRYRLGGKSMKHLFEIKDKVAIASGFNNRQELNNHVMCEYLKGTSLNQISKGLSNVSAATCRRIVDEITREKLNVEDFE